MSTDSPAALDPAAENSFSALQPEDAIAVTAFINEATPDAKYATYYAAMGATFSPASSLIAKENGEITVALIGLDKISFEEPETRKTTRIFSHLVTSEARTGDIEYGLLTQAFEQAANDGVSDIIFDLSQELDPLLKSHIEDMAYDHDVNVNFNAEANDNIELLDFRHKGPRGITYRHPTPQDAQAMLDVVMATQAGNSEGGLDIYALSSYQRMCKYFPETSLVAENETGEIIGFTTGFLLPKADQKELFIWQFGVDPEKGQRKGAGSVMVQTLLEQTGAQGLTTTIEGDNDVSINTFKKTTARKDMALLERTTEISSDVLGHGHKPEVIFKFG
jgi:L-2,4-diaminobutyric acid acetyltransferase